MSVSRIAEAWSVQRRGPQRLRLAEERGAVYGVPTLIIPSLVTFLPGVILTTGMIELA